MWNPDHLWFTHVLPVSEAIVEIIVFRHDLFWAWSQRIVWLLLPLPPSRTLKSHYTTPRYYHCRLTLQSLPQHYCQYHLTAPTPLLPLQPHTTLITPSLLSVPPHTATILLPLPLYHHRHNQQSSPSTSSCFFFSSWRLLLRCWYWWL